MKTNSPYLKLTVGMMRKNMRIERYRDWAFPGFTHEHKGSCSLQMAGTLWARPLSSQKTRSLHEIRFLLHTEIPHLCAEMLLVCVTVCSRKIYCLKFVLKRPAEELQTSHRHYSGALQGTWHTVQTKTKRESEKTQLYSEACCYFIF